MILDFDFTVLEDSLFKEDAVREEIIRPLLKELGYKGFGKNKIIYSMSLKHPFVSTGAGAKRMITNFPDYTLLVNNKYVWVLDAKSPKEEIVTGPHREQAYFYAIHPDVRVDYYALCNGYKLVVFKINETEAILNVNISELDKYWTKVEEVLSPQSFIRLSPINLNDNIVNEKFDYSNCVILPQLAVKKQQAKRHFGVHGYFTKQSWNVVQKYIENFTKPGDTVLDPFGGSGVTFVEALMIGRKGIHIDINPMSIFMVEALLAPIHNGKLNEEFNKIKNQYNRNTPSNGTKVIEYKKKYPHPKKIELIKGSDTQYIEGLFTDKQLAQLGYLKYLISKVKDISVRKSLLLAFSSSITKFNRTYHPSKSRGDNAGDCAAFRYYRYRIAKDEVNLDLMKIFETKVEKLKKAKAEIFSLINPSTSLDNLIIKGSACSLPLQDESVDYIYTDPPYGSKIPYLDLSVMWNSWLDFEVTEEDYLQEAIEGGKLNKSVEEYSALIESSIKEMYRVLKFNRWLSFVFAHKDPKYWHLIVETAEKYGFEFAGAVKQPNGQTTYKKRQNPFSVLSGQLIVNFRKVKTPESIQKIKLGADIFAIIIETIESVIAFDDGATLEQINDELILKGLELGFLDVLSKEYKDLTPILMEHFDYDSTTSLFRIKQNKKFKTHINVHLRIRYFLISYLKRKKQEKMNPSTDQIILDIMPLLKNGVTPENQTILAVLDTVAERVSDNNWRIKPDIQLNLNV